MSGADLYILRCADGSCYVGSARNGLEARLAEHNSGRFNGYTAKRLPVTLVFAQHFETITDAIAAERQVKGWSRAKKQALISGNWQQIELLAHRHAAHPSRRPPAAGSSG
jgi:putative endonuclease